MLPNGVDGRSRWAGGSPGPVRHIREIKKESNLEPKHADGTQQSGNEEKKDAGPTTCDQARHNSHSEAGRNITFGREWSDD